MQSEPTGFDYWEVLTGQGDYYNPDFKTAAGPTKYTGYATDIVTDRTLDWLKNHRDPSKPFMLMSQHKAPHRSWMPGPDHLTLYDDATIPEPPTLFDDYSHRCSAVKATQLTVARHLTWAFDLKLDPPDPKQPWDVNLWKATYGRLNEQQRKVWDAAYGPRNDAFRKINLKGQDLVRWKYQRYIKDYLRCIASVDDNIGRILKYLDDTGLAGNTVVIYSSDQGFFLGDHGLYDKRFMYEESLRMPFIVRWPNVIKPRSANKDLVQNLDFAETFLEIAGADVPPDMQGRSVVSLLKGQTPSDWRKTIYYHYLEQPGYGAPRHCGVRTDRYKLIHYYDLNEWELFDLEKDPEELRSVYDDPAYADIVKELKAELRHLQAYYKDTNIETKQK